MSRRAPRKSRPRSEPEPHIGKLLYSPEQIQFVLDARLTRAQEYRQIATEFAEKWGGARTSEQMRHLFRTYSQPGALQTATASAVESPQPTELAPHKYAQFTRAAFGGVKRVNAKPRARFFVTAASPVSNLSEMMEMDGATYGQNLHFPLFQTIMNYCARMNAELVLLPLRAHMPALVDQPAHYDPRLWEFRDAFASEFVFNEHLKALDIHMNPQQVHPLTGLFRIRGGRTDLLVEVDGRQVAQRFNQSLIIAHAKQDLEPVATGNGTIARLLHTTGACTLPEYLSNRIGVIAAENHTLGGLIVEVDEDRFYVRQVQAHPADGSFCDLGWQYFPSGEARPVRAEALRPGDLHAGLEDSDAMEAHAQLARLVRPKKEFVEDVFDAGSISHHKDKLGVTKAQRPPQFKSLEAELTWCRSVLSDLFEDADVDGDGDIDFIIVESNHHEHLGRYLDEGRYIKDDANYELAHRMVVDTLDGKDPLRMRLDPEGNYIWLRDDEDYFVEGVQMAAHGHLGENGARGSAAQMERVHWNSMTGHAHTPRIRGRAFVVGHLSRARHGYNRGPSTWLHCMGLVWPGGQKQLVISIDGRFMLPLEASELVWQHLARESYLWELMNQAKRGPWIADAEMLPGAGYTEVEDPGPGGTVDVRSPVAATNQQPTSPAGPPTGDMAAADQPVGHEDDNWEEEA